MNRLCDFIYYLGPTANLMVKTCRKYVGSVMSSWRLVDNRVVPSAGAREGLHLLALARYAEQDRRLSEQTAHADVELLRAVLADTCPPIVVCAAILLGFHFVPRTGEFVKSESGADWDRNLLRWEDIDFVEAVGGDASARAIRLRFHHRKTNTPTCGQVQEHQRQAVPGDPLCVVAALFAYRDDRRAKGLADPPPRAPIFLRDDGRPLAASDITEALRAGARTLERSTKRLTTYSLRTGGATQLKRAGIDDVAVMYAGGWAEVSSMRGYAHHVPSDHAWLSEVLVDGNPLARAARASARLASAPPAKRRRV